MSVRQRSCLDLTAKGMGQVLLFLGGLFVLGWIAIQVGDAFRPVPPPPVGLNPALSSSAPRVP